MYPENSQNLPIRDIAKEIRVSEVERLAELVHSVKPKMYTKTDRLTNDEKLYLISMIAHCYSISEIQKEMIEKFKKVISSPLIHQYNKSKKWRDVIKKIREEYEINVSASKMFSKRSRLDRLERIYDRAVDQDDIDAQIKVVTQSHKEVEGGKDGDTNNFFVNNPVYNQLNLLSNEELLKRHKEATERLKIKKEN